MKKKVVDIETHAFFRMIERGSEFGLDYYETKDRAFKTAKLGKPPKRKHLSGKNKSYCCYFKDNISFYVICREKEFEKYIKCLIKTVIIEKGRQ